MAETHALLIGGEWVGSASGALFDDVNPADAREVVARFAAGTAADARRAVDAAAAAFPAWRTTPRTRTVPSSAAARGVSG